MARWTGKAASRLADFAKTISIRLSRPLVYLLPGAFLLYIVWTSTTRRLG
jgi:hypothetical protein